MPFPVALSRAKGMGPAMLFHAKHVAVTMLGRKHSREHKRHKKKFTPPEISDAVLDQVKLLSELLGAIADGPLNVPMLKGVSTLVGKLIAITQAVRSNREDCERIAHQICDHLSLIATTYHPNFGCGETLVDKEGSRLHEHIVLLHRALEEILFETQKLVSRTKWRRILFHESDRRGISACEGRLQHIFARFQLSATIAHSQDIHSLHVDVTNVKSLARSSLSYSSRISHKMDVMMILVSGVLFAKQDVLVYHYVVG